jgi:signal transduction histidine kinase
MQVDQAVAVVRECRLFRDLEEECLSGIARVARREFFPAGHILFRAGEPATTAYLVEEGSVAIDIDVKFGMQTRRTATIEMVSRGHIAGWSAVASAKEYSATARCIEDTCAYAIDGDSFRGLFRADTGLGYTVMRRLVGLVRSRADRLTNTLAHVLSIASHDLKAPLHAVQSYHQVMLGGYAGDLTEKQRDMLVRCGERIKGLLELIDSVLDLSRLESGDMEKSLGSLVPIAEVCIENIRPQAASKGIHLEKRWDDHLPPVLVNSPRLQQAITNLLSNAVKFTPEGGRIALEMTESGRDIVVSVMDDGVGIGEDEIQKVFDDFFRGKGSNGTAGAGLGLSIARKIIKAHGGKMWAESPCSRFGRGTKVSFTLPKIGE